MMQVDQVLCDTCGEIPASPRADIYRRVLAMARRHAEKEHHDVHVLVSDSRHYYGSRAAGGN